MKPVPSNMPSRNPSDKQNNTQSRQGIKKSTLIKIILVSLIVATAIGYIAWDIIAKGPLTQLLSNRDELVRVINKVGPLAPLVYILLQIVQVVVAPIPGQIVGGVGGFLFGHWGILWTSIGSIIGFWLVFLIARRFGRPLIERVFSKSAVAKFDFIINANGAAFIIFAVFLLPGFPDDLICYLAGLTKLPMRKLLLISILGRFPTIVLTNYIGMGISGNIGLVVVLSLVAVVIVGLAAWKRDKILAFLKHEGPTGEPSAKVSAKDPAKISTKVSTKGQPLTSKNTNNSAAKPRKSTKS